MKIYKPNKIRESENAFDFIDLLLENELDLEEKMLNLSSAYEKLILTPGAIDKLIGDLFYNLNTPLSFSRKGDNNERVDAKAPLGDGNLGIIEIEVPSTAMLDAPRNLLDDIAVEVNRNKSKLEQIIPITLCWTFPNNRSDYWNVVHDIKKVLNIKIKTISIMSLAVCYWTEHKLELKDETFYVDIDNNELKIIIDILSPKGIDTTKFEGFFSPYK
ncbi:hypothetical protein ACFC53_09875 [Enterococcus casseliflavus]|uniref:hypothetical protein n=1 Tax=Enterococcus casseliflavus TaxID=37734 RepID=UPI0035DAE30F